MNSRQPVGYVVEVDGMEVTLNLLDHYRGMVAAHYDGVSQVTEIGSLLGIDSGHELLVLRVNKVNFAEPREVHRRTHGSATMSTGPLRNIKGTIVGVITRIKKKVKFNSSRLRTPALGAAACPLQNSEMKSILSHNDRKKIPITVGTDLRSGLQVGVDLQDFISRHVAVLGGSGQGKSCFTASFLQQVADLPNPRVVIFDINGEYRRAFEDRVKSGQVLVTRLGSDYKIPYYSLGKQGIQRLLIPSDKSQSPSLKFALNSLKFVKWFSEAEGVGLDDCHAVLFDDCRGGNANEANNLISALRDGFRTDNDLIEGESDSVLAKRWPPMKSLGPLVADSYSLTRISKSDNWTRSSFLYDHVSPLIMRIHRFVDDSMFSSVIDIEEGEEISNSGFEKEENHLIDMIFGSHTTEWKVHVVDLQDVAQDLLPVILGSLLDLYAHKLFKRGQDRMIPTLLVLEEAHHYIKAISYGSDEGTTSLAYERLAKEGRKFGLALWLSTQRPSEISPTVLSQCNSWVSFRLTSEKDIAAVQFASEWADRMEVRRVSGLSRRNALLFGGNTNMPILIRSKAASPLPKSGDAPFNSWGIEKPKNVDKRPLTKDDDTIDHDDAGDETITSDTADDDGGDNS